jgi:hypothetical protein
VVERAFFIFSRGIMGSEFLIIIYVGFYMKYVYVYVYYLVCNCGREVYCILWCEDMSWWSSGFIMTRDDKIG